MAGNFGSISRSYAGRIAQAVDDVEAMRRSGSLQKTTRPVPQPAPPVPIMLKTDLEPSDDGSPTSATAWQITFENGQPKLPEETSDTITVWDISGSKRAYGKDHWSESGDLTGALGWARQCLPSDQFTDGYAITELQLLVARCWATLDGDMDSSDATASVKEMSNIGDGQTAFAEDATATVDNPLGKSGSDGDTCIIERDVDGTWFVVESSNSGLEEVTAVTGIQVSGKTLQKKTRSFKASGRGDESDWTTWHTGTECE